MERQDVFNLTADGPSSRPPYQEFAQTVAMEILSGKYSLNEENEIILIIANIVRDHRQKRIEAAEEAVKDLKTSLDVILKI